MAETSLTNRKYNFSDADFIIFCNTLSSVMTRDLAEMALYGITSDTISDFEDLVNAFQALPSDDLLRADLSYAVEERDNKRNLMMNYMRSIAARSKAIYGENSAKYRSLAPGALSKLSDSNLLLAAGQVHSAATTNLTELAAEGVTALYLTEFQTAINNFEASINDVSDKKNLRDNGTENKISKGNELYALVVKYCDYGKLIWENISPAKYNDYVIYTQSSPGTLTAPGNLVFNYASKTLWWDTVNNATSYQLQWYDGVDYIEIFAGDADNFIYIPQDGLNKFRVRAHNAGGYGPFSEILNQYYYEVLPKATNIQIEVSGTIPSQAEVTWNEIPTVTTYKVFQSIDNIGEPPAHWLVVATVTSTSKTCTLTLGKRNYFKIESLSPYQTSMSDPVFIDV